MNPLSFRRRRDPEFLLDQLANWPCGREVGWVFGLENIPEAEEPFSRFMQNIAGSGVQAFVQPVWLPARSVFGQMLIAGPLPHAAFRAGIPGDRAGWGWFSWRSLNTTFCGKLEEAFGVRFMGDQLVPYHSSPTSTPASWRTR